MKLKGKREYDKFLNGKKLTPKQAILAQCYMCNGFEESNCDCMTNEPNGLNKCPLYFYHPHRKK